MTFRDSGFIGFEIPFKKASENNPPESDPPESDPPESNPKEEIGVLYGFRAIMIFLVAAFHIYQQSWMRQEITFLTLHVDFTNFIYSGYLFVDGLILLSGFLLFLPCVRKQRPPYAPDFWFHRARRILPSYWVAILLSFFCIALPDHSYQNTSAAADDLISHLLFLQMFRKSTYLLSPINGAVWTIVVEVQFYLLFPLLARLALKKAWVTLPAMALLAWTYRYCVSTFCEDTSYLVNQFPAYLDVFALGMLGAKLYAWLSSRARCLRKTRLWPFTLLCSLLFLASCFALYRLTVYQTTQSNGYEALRHSQMKVELPFAALMLLCMLSASFAWRPLQKLLDNRLMRFLSAISLNFYIWHQALAVQLRLRWFPDTNALHTTLASQSLYTYLCFLTVFVAAMALTYGVEKPGARLMNRLQSKITTTQDGKQA